MKKIAVAGAGAMGGRVGVQLKQSGADITLIDTWQPHVDAVQQNGLEIQTETDTYTVDISMITPNEATQPYDLIILLTKAMDAGAMIQALQQSGAINDHTAILSMMNGLGHHELLGQYVPQSQIYLGVTMWTAGLRGPGQLLLEGTGSIDLNSAIASQEDARTKQIAALLERAQLNPTISDDIYTSVWSKATVNSVLNPLCTILDKTIGEFAAYDQSRTMIIPIISEIVAVAHARGVDISADTLRTKIENAYPNSTQGLHYPSMHQDHAQKRLTEIDYLNGRISTYGAELGIPTPTNDLLTHLVHQLELKY